MQDVMETVKLNRESELKGTGPVTGRRSTINCHTNYNSGWGHACVFLNGYMYNVTWTQVNDTAWVNGNYVVYPDTHTEYSSVSVHSCNC
jgi:hypothetical protein